MEGQSVTTPKQEYTLAAEIRIRAERKCGEILAATPKAKGTRLAGGDSTGAPIVVAPAEDTPTLASVLNHRAQGTGQNEWYTPAEYIEAVRDVLGTRIPLQA
jgi:hypothetical protein